MAPGKDRFSQGFYPHCARLAKNRSEVLRESLLVWAGGGRAERGQVWLGWVGLLAACLAIHTTNPERRLEGVKTHSDWGHEKAFRDAGQRTQAWPSLPVFVSFWSLSSGDLSSVLPLSESLPVDLSDIARQPVCQSNAWLDKPLRGNI